MLPSKDADWNAFFHVTACSKSKKQIKFFTREIKLPFCEEKPAFVVFSLVCACLWNLFTPTQATAARIRSSVFNARIPQRSLSQHHIHLQQRSLLKLLTASWDTFNCLILVLWHSYPYLLMIRADYRRASFKSSQLSLNQTGWISQQDTHWSTVERSAARSSCSWVQTWPSSKKQR